MWAILLTSLHGIFTAASKDACHWVCHSHAAAFCRREKEEGKCTGEGGINMLDQQWAEPHYRWMSSFFFCLWINCSFTVVSHIQGASCLLCTVWLIIGGEYFPPCAGGQRPICMADKKMTLISRFNFFLQPNCFTLTLARFAWVLQRKIWSCGHDHLYHGVTFAISFCHWIGCINPQYPDNIEGYFSQRGLHAALWHFAWVRYSSYSEESWGFTVYGDQCRWTAVLPNTEPQKEGKTNKYLWKMLTTKNKECSPAVFKNKWSTKDILHKHANANRNIKK